MSKNKNTDCRFKETGAIMSTQVIYVVRCAIWYHLYNLKNVKDTHGEVLILVKLQAEACEISVIIILIYRKLGSVGPVQQKVKLPSPQKCKKQLQGGV